MRLDTSEKVGMGLTFEKDSERDLQDSEEHMTVRTIFISNDHT